MFNFDGNQLVLNNSPFLWADLALSLLLAGGILFFVFYILKRRFVQIFAIVGVTLLLLTWVFPLGLAHNIVSLILIVGAVVFYTANIGEVRTLIANSLASKKKTSGGLFTRGKDADKLFDREALYDKIETTINALSKTKTGALITIERNVDLSDIAKSGTILHAPVIPELLATIFYTGTRLHDGAVIIRRDEIYAAAVYFTPTTKPLTGKFGSRHRAAIGISEISDAVTIVVSEETGRVSLAVAGDLIHVGLDNFRRVFEDYMNSSVNKDELNDIA